MFVMADWSELEMVRGASGHVCVTERLREFDPKKKAFVDKPIKLRIPRPNDLAQARVDVRAMFLAKKLDPDKDKDLFDEFEQLCLLSKAIRDAETEAQLYDPIELAQSVDEGPLQDLLGRLRVYRDMLDPRERLMTDEEVYTKIIEVARAGHLYPLTDIAGRDQPSFVTTMACLAATSPTVLAWLQSCETSTLAASSPGI
jgi:hypothetical protein